MVLGPHGQAKVVLLRVSWEPGHRLLEALHTELEGGFKSDPREKRVFWGYIQCGRTVDQNSQSLPPLGLVSCGDECLPIMNVSTRHGHVSGETSLC